MSLCTVNAALAVSARRQQRLCLIASRRQIDAAAVGGGYVNGWTSESFSNYVSERDARGLLTLARDHGGPYQRDEEKGLSLKDALPAAIQSYQVDILAGFKILHLDPERAVDRASPEALRQFTDLTTTMLLAADDFAKSKGIMDVRFEIGTDEGVGEDFTLSQWSDFLTAVMAAAKAHSANAPVAFAVPMGTKVKEMQNVGGWVTGGTGVKAQWADRIDGLRALARSHGVMLKLHNADYLSSAQLEQIKSMGVPCINVAPEFGVVETRTFLRLLRQHGLHSLAEQFLETAYASRRWERWLLLGSTATDEEKAVMAGHYVFALPEMVALRAAAQSAIAVKGVDLNRVLQSDLENFVDHYLNALAVSRVSERAA